MKLTERLHHAAAPIWQTTLRHPFVTELGDGTLPLEKFRFYMCQDYVFLIEYSRLLALATAKSPDLVTMGRFANLLDATLNREMALHREFASQCGISATTLAQTKTAPTTHAYTRHLVSVAAFGDFAEVIAALLPCQWGYCEIGQLLAQRGKPLAAPFYCQWIDMYASPEFAALATWLREVLDAHEGMVREDRLQEIFITSAKYEFLFWDMAYRQEEWLL
jgi:thiaminase/transcriptional activator TenA